MSPAPSTDNDNDTVSSELVSLTRATSAEGLS